MESELFGYEKGAFTGASATKKGKFEHAHGGTVFLDEIGDLTFELQAKLLRVLQTNEVYKVGSTTPVSVDVRIVAATHKDLQLAVNQGHFRLDLYYRLSVFPIHLPALRERGNDVELLSRHFLLIANTEYGKNLYCGPDALRHLARYEWPGISDNWRMSCGVSFSVRLVQRFLLIAWSRSWKRNPLSGRTLNHQH